MGRARDRGNGKLEEAVTLLLQNQASLLQNQTAFVARMAEIDARMAETTARMAETNHISDERFVRIEALLLEHNRILSDHTVILQALPEAIREKIGFKPRES